MPNITILDPSKARPISHLESGSRYKLPLITNRKSHMNFRLVPNSVTLNDPERHNSPNRCVISSNSVAFGMDYVTVVQDTPILSAAEM